MRGWSPWRVAAGIEAALDGWIAPGSVLCSDGAAAYVKAAVKAGAEHRRVALSNSARSFAALVVAQQQVRST
jgi:hypothetical protein